MLDGSPGVPPSASFHQHLSEANRLFQSNPYQPAPGVVASFAQHLHPTLQQHQHNGPNNPHGAPQHPGASALGQPQHNGGNCMLAQMPHGLSSVTAAIFASSPMISEDVKLAAAAAAAAAQSRGKKTHRAEPVPQSGFKGVSWNSRMKAWLAFYVTENGERKSKTFSTRKLGMEEARLQAISFCKQKQDQRREARKRNRGHQAQHGGGSNLDKLSSDESMLGSPSSMQQQHQQQHQSAAMRCGYPTVPGMTLANSQIPPTGGSAGGDGCGAGGASQSTNGSEIAYVPIVPIAMDMIEKSGLLQPLELNVLPPCQHCNKQPYPFLMIVSEGQEQTYSGSSIMSLASHSSVSANAPSSSDPNNNANVVGSGVGGGGGQINRDASSGPGDSMRTQSPNGGAPMSLITSNGSDAPTDRSTTELDVVSGPPSKQQATTDGVESGGGAGSRRSGGPTVGGCYRAKQLLQLKLPNEDDETSSDVGGAMSSNSSAYDIRTHHLHFHHGGGSQAAQVGSGGFNMGESSGFNMGETASSMLSLPGSIHDARNLMQQQIPRLGGASTHELLQHMQEQHSTGQGIGGISDDGDDDGGQQSSVHLLQQQQQQQLGDEDSGNGSCLSQHHHMANAFRLGLSSNESGGEEDDDEEEGDLREHEQRLQ